MTGTKMAADGDKPEVENSTTSSSSSGRCGAGLVHLCVIYGLLVLYGLWAATSYQLMRRSLLDECLQRGNLVTSQLVGPCEILLLLHYIFRCIF